MHPIRNATSRPRRRLLFLVALLVLPGGAVVALGIGAVAHLLRRRAVRPPRGI